jgi:hypothetical protein
MRCPILIAALMLINTYCAAQQCTSGNIGAGVTCACNIEWDTNHVTEPGGDELRVYDVCYQTSAGVNNKNRIAVFIHPGAWWLRLDGSVPTAAQIQGIVNKGVNLYIPAYTVLSYGQLTSQINPGDTHLVAKQALNGLCPNDPTLVSCIGSGGYTVRVDSEVFQVTSMTGDYRSAATFSFSGQARQRHAVNTYQFFPALGWPIPANDLASLMSFLAQCSAGGLTPGTGSCASFSTVPGDPQRIVRMGASAGGLLGLRFLQDKCDTGTRCPYLNNKVGTEGYTPWTARTWRVFNPFGKSSIGWSDELDPPAVYAQNQLTGRQHTGGTTVAVMLCGCTPACDNNNPSSFNLGPWISTFSYSLNYVVTYKNTSYISLINNNLGNEPDANSSNWQSQGAAGSAAMTCTHNPSACYTSCTSKLSPLALSVGGHHVPVTGWLCDAQLDGDFQVIDALIGRQPNMSSTYYAGQHHGCGTTNTNGQAYLDTLTHLGSGGVVP